MRRAMAWSTAGLALVAGLWWALGHEQGAAPAAPQGSADLAGADAGEAPAIDTDADGPRLLDPGMAQALVHQRAILTAMTSFEVDGRLPPPVSHSAGAAHVESDDAQAMVDARPPREDKDKIALFFSGGEVGETDPCG